MKKVTALLFVLSLIVSLTFTGNAAVPQKIRSINPDMAQKLEFFELNGSAITVDELTDLNINAGSELYIYLQDKDGASFFNDQNGTPISTGDLTMSRLYSAQLGVEQIEGESQIIESIQLGFGSSASFDINSAPYVRIKFTDQCISIDDLPFSATVALTLGGQVQQQSALEIYGVLETESRDVYAADMPIDIEDGTIINALEDISSAKLIIADNVTITANLEEGQRYCGKVEVRQASPSELGIQAENMLYDVYTLSVINLDNPDTTVKINSESTQFVYNAAGEFMGTTRNELPFSDEYILTNKKIDLLSNVY